LRGRTKRKAFNFQIKQAEESIKRGFALLRRDIEEELSILHQAQLSDSLSAQEKIREEELKRDLADIESYVGKEIWEVEKYEGAR
jgi:hypothetical protein